MESRFSCDTQMSPRRSVLSQHLVCLFFISEMEKRHKAGPGPGLGPGPASPMMMVQALSSPISFFSVTRSGTFFFFFVPSVRGPCGREPFCPSMSSSPGPVRPPSPQSSPHSVFMRTERAALAQQPATVRGRMLNTRDSARCVQGREESSGAKFIWTKFKRESSCFSSAASR